ncbi:MAG: hypothetical protein IJT03_07030 [Clostridia bacterium]|nr:hypothetical protein [Clostridia bacterium]
MNSAKILKTTFSNISFRLEVEKKDSLQLKIETKSRILPPNDKDNKTALFIIKAKINDVDAQDIEIVVTANIIFEFDEIPEDYNTVATDLCLKMAQQTVFEKIDNILMEMGFPKFGIQTN